MPLWLGLAFESHLPTLCTARISACSLSKPFDAMPSSLLRLVMLSVVLFCVRLQAQEGASARVETEPARKMIDGFIGINNAALLSFEVPSVVLTGQTFKVSITFSNSGTRVWNTNEPQHWLGELDAISEKIWTTSRRIPMPANPVRPGDVATFSLECIAPEQPGLYPFSWRMIEEFVEFFGPAANHVITVRERSEADTADKKTNAMVSAASVRPPRPLFDYNAKVFQTDEGLPQNTVQAIHQTRDGYLWIGTQKGLARFDGVRFVACEEPELKNSFIYALLESRDGSLWVGTFDSGLIRIRDGKATRFSEADGLASSSVRSLFESRDGSLWIGTTNGLSHFNDGKFEPVRANFPGEVIRGFCEDRLGRLWVGTGHGAICVANDAVGPTLGSQQGLPGANVKTLMTGRDGSIWIGVHGGVAQFKDGQLTAITQSEGLSHDVVNAVFEDTRGDIWVGTYGGLNRYADGQCRTELTADGAAFDTVNSITQDTEGNIWVGCKDGLYRLRVRPFTTYTRQHGLIQNNVMSVFEDRQGRFWIGTWGGGLHLFQQGRIEPWKNNKSLSSQLVLALCEDHFGTLWAGADFNGGLNRILDDFNLTYRQSEGLPDGGVRAICEDRSGNLWVGTSRGLALLRNGTFVQFTSKDGLAGNTIRVLHEDNEGNLWIGSNEGLSRHRNGTFETFAEADGLSGKMISALYEDNDHDLWIGTTGGGLNRLPKAGDSRSAARKPKFISCTSKQGLFSDDIFEILEDDSGYLWMTCRNGVFRTKKSSLKDLTDGRISKVICQSLGLREGLASVECNSVAKPAAWKSRDGRLWFATSKGLSVVDPALHLKFNDVVPPVVIEEIISDKKVQSSKFKVQSQENRSSDSTLNVKPETLNLPPGRGELEIHYTALSFTSPEKNRFRYKLENVDTEWVEAGSRRVAYYNNLRPGSYTFRVKAANNDGIWNESGAATSVRLLPHFWQANWFIVVCVLGSIGVVAGIARFVTKRRLQRKLQLLEQQHAIEKERTRIAQDMHDDLGARLTEILLLSDRVQKSEGREAVEAGVTISEVTREVAAGMNAIVWAVNPKNDSLDKMVSYISNYAVKFLARSSIECRLDVPAELPPWPVASEMRHNFFLVAKEALNNVVKHSGASEVTIQLRLKEVEFTGKSEKLALTLTIQDNGKGFATSEDAASGNGLLNMRKRIESTGGCLEVHSEMGKGTRVSLVISLHR